MKPQFVGILSIHVAVSRPLQLKRVVVFVRILHMLWKIVTA